MNVLRDPWLRIATPSGLGTYSLSGALALLLSTEPGEVTFTGTTAPQRGHLLRLLVRCAARGLDDLAGVPDDCMGRKPEELGEELSRVLAEAAGGLQHWDLFGEAYTRAAFLQVPVEGEKAPWEVGYKWTDASLLTSVIGSKNHERKVGVSRSLDPESAILALVEYQGGAIYGGVGHYGGQLIGSASGKGSGTPFMGVEFPDEAGRTFRHNVGLFLRARETIRVESALQGEVWALWTLPWDGTTSLSGHQLHPFFIPLARRVRLTRASSGRVEGVLVGTTKSSRVDDHTEGGDFGDPFLPLRRNPKDLSTWKVRGTLDTGYSYKELVQILIDPDFRPSPSVARLRDSPSLRSEEVYVVLEGLAFEQGKTLGFHHRRVLLPQGRLGRLLSSPDPYRLVHDYMLSRVTGALRALRGALRVLMFGDAKPRRGDDAKVATAAQMLEAEVDDRYIPFLVEAGESQQGGEEGYREEWPEWLGHRALGIFELAKGSVPVNSGIRFQREIEAEEWLRRKLRELKDSVPILEQRSAE